MDEGILVGAVLQLLATQNFRCALGPLTELVKTRKIILIKNASYLKVFLQKFPSNFHFANTDGTRVVVFAHTDLVICQDHCSASGCRNSECQQLHICKYFLMSDSCTYHLSNKGCQYGHDLRTPHNQQLLWEHNLHTLGLESLRRLYQLPTVRKNSSALVPPVCRFYNLARGCNKDAEKCSNLHLCSHIIIDNCKFEGRCLKSHNIMDPSIQKLLNRYGINTRCTPAEILSELKFYHGPQSGLLSAGSLRQATSMVSLQPGLSLAPGLPPPPSVAAAAPAQTDFGGARPKNPPKLIGKQRSQSQPRAPGQRENRAPSGKPPPKGSKAKFSEGEDESTKICSHFLGGKCRFAEKCSFQHKPFVYQWQFRGMGGGTWQDLEANEDIEKSFCIVKNEDCFIDQTMSSGGKVTLCVLFGTMTAQGPYQESYSIRRLSTDSLPAALHGLRRKFANEWRWYFQDIKRNWCLYGSQDCNGFNATKTSEEIEKEYIENPDATVEFSTTASRYELNFQRMVQTNMETQVVRLVRRRPVFLRAADIEARQQELQQGKTKGAAKTADLVPVNWSARARALSSEDDLSSHYSLEEVSDVSSEYNMVTEKFFMTMSQGVHISKVERVENGELWLSFCHKKEQMKRKAGGKTAEEKMLFHGTQQEYVTAISRQGFDFRLSGTSSGIKWGKGSYFARDAHYSNAFCRGPTPRQMFLVRVLAGVCTQGNKSYSRPPPRNPAEPHGDLFDSCVDDMSNPSIYVIFTLDQVYPQYVITYNK